MLSVIDLYLERHRGLPFKLLVYSLAAPLLWRSFLGYRKLPRSTAVLAPAGRFGLSLDAALLAREHEQTPRAHNKFHGKIEKQHGARNPIDDQGDNSPDGKRVGEEHCPDHSYVLPAWSEERRC